MSDIYGIRTPHSKVAFVTGANGISGSAIVEHLIKQSASEWSAIIVTSRSPIKAVYTDPRVRFIAIDFLEPAEAIAEKIQGLCADVTHAFFTSYTHNNDFSQLHQKNGPLFRHLVEAVDLACPKLQRVVLQTGGKHYGFQFRDFTTPFLEDMPRYEGPENIFYYEQEDDLFAVQKRRNTWSYNIIRPMAIIGYSCQYLGINESLPLAQYFLICRELGEAPRWPGSLESYHRVEKQSSAMGIANLTVWAATDPDCKDEAFNHDDGDVIVWKFLWHLLAKYFRVSMDDFEAPTAATRPFDLGEWAQDKKAVWERIVAKYGGDPEAFQIDAFRLMNWCITPAANSAPVMSTVVKARRFGWVHSDDTYQSWLNTMRAYENAGVLPTLPSCS
ncbi:SDR family oxidoreductase [Aspergillus fijiensis CBS 313.89]|uniref:Nucleoside-diphosphate-sugar epimerase GsfE n=1 Tax=Aspergillus fijiensis CBS 313.89 TaxID=1448319 RepID=A0A8G1VTX6_9EURO|nr:nucleoside-diphosphate-sugar epimerase GsfE [Aspergillus fijiensis CBS 313.89]RAK71493.1 nucleoside-diphosphate-sugar epimerase GsfE [Aspergillus fijiensis CBS 313.89]